MPRHFIPFVLLVCTLFASAAGADPVPASTFRITFDAATFDRPYTGRVYVVLARRPSPEPRLRMGSWFGAPQVFAMDVADLPTGGSITLGPDALAFPKPYADAEPGELHAQAVARVNPDSPNPGRGDGDLYSEPLHITFTPSAAPDAPAAELRLTKTVQARPFRETDRIRLVDIPSPSLSEFHGREIRLRAGVYLPEGWNDDPDRRYPTIYFITGFGGDHAFIHAIPRMIPPDAPAQDVIWVVPDPLCFRGHSVFADSANNGPRGHALLRELIPEVERRFHGASAPDRRYVTGISSGGWSSLWLQVAYPDDFAGCWSHCPDPVDFRDFQRIDLYAPDANMYRDEHGERRPLARQGDRVILHYDDFVRQETVMGPGGQIHAFEAVFSPRAANGEPEPLFDRATGAVNPTVAKAWEAYDIRLILERNWPTLGPKLVGKLHIYAGETDNFYLEGAARLLKDSLQRLGSDAEVVIVPGMGHSIHDPGVRAMLEAIAARNQQ